MLPNSNGSHRSAIDQAWSGHASTALHVLRQISPQRATSPDLLLRQAANSRDAGTIGDSSTLLSDASRSTGPFALFAKAELQSVNGAASSSLPTINLARQDTKPFLDGNLTDSCWESATEIHLTSANSQMPQPAADCMVMMAWDDEHLFLAARMENVHGRQQQPDRTVDRLHDASHETRDRIQFQFDTDRDFVTGFEFTVDETGQTSDRCWQARNWNPNWYVADASDDATWRFEAAIPRSELNAGPIRPGDIWSVKIIRTAPGVVQQNLPPTDANTATDGYGLLRFIR